MARSRFIKHWHGLSLRLLIEKCAFQILWHVASNLIRKKKGRLGTRRTAIPVRFLKGRTCAGSECSKNLGHLGPWGIVVDTTPVLWPAWPRTDFPTLSWACVSWTHLGCGVGPDHLRWKTVPSCCDHDITGSPGDIGLTGQERCSEPLR
jgi:hypothetical protein